MELPCNRALASVDLTSWNDFRQKLKRRSDKWLAELSLESDARVPIAPKRLSSLFLSAGLLGTTLVRCEGNIPKGTLILVMAQTVVFLKPNGVSLRNVSLLPYKVVQRKEFHRLVVSAFVHSDLTHVMFNVNSLIEAGLVMEPHMGAVPFLLDVSMLNLLAHGIYVSAAWIEKEKLGLPATYYSLDAIGFSCVAFALNVLTGATNNSRGTSDSSLPIPVAYHVWAQLALTSLFMPRSNLLGHLSGILAGLIRVFVPRPFVWLRRKVTGLIGVVTEVSFENKTEDVRRVCSNRSKRQLLNHLCIFVVSAAFHVFRQKRSMQ